ncbi:MAG: hypothetical protein K0R12_1386 [Gammaproteobacteria bacterium]|nr:hypothetical protein [Gammaproteobacteria bacterium]
MVNIDLSVKRQLTDMKLSCYKNLFKQSQSITDAPVAQLDSAIPS